MSSPKPAPNPEKGQTPEKGQASENGRPVPVRFEDWASI
jgi:hypothetical protein